MPPTPRPDDSPDVAELLQCARGGDPTATEQLVDLVYDELRDLARGLLRRGSDGTLSATGLVHEAYVRLRGGRAPDLETRRHFNAFAARIMRNVLVDQVRHRRAQKRGGDVTFLPLDESLDLVAAGRFDWLELDEALERLAAHDAQLGRLVELRFFGGLSNEDLAAELGVTVREVRREWNFAKAWLQRELSRDESTPAKP